MALEGLRDLSVIATAPQRRLAIKTFVRNEGNGVIREAVLRELKRGGQVYFLHNEVETIENRRQKLEEILPEARIAVAHGQMPERELERVMRDFVAQRYNLLLCSTIIETGIDVPTANTIVISRADKFGLAQLHQLRGRVGRSHHQAYAYLMVPDTEGLTKQASSGWTRSSRWKSWAAASTWPCTTWKSAAPARCWAKPERQHAGSGLPALQRDAGRGRALPEERQGARPAERRCRVTTDINLHAPALLPDDYCGDVHLRLSFYKKLATAKTADQIDALLEEIVDRFGKLPAQAQTLIDVHRLRVLSQPYGVVKVDAAPGVIHITFKPNPPVDSMRIIELIQKNRHIKLVGNEKLRIERELPSAVARAQMVRDVLRWAHPWRPRRRRTPVSLRDTSTRTGLQMVERPQSRRPAARTQTTRRHPGGRAQRRRICQWPRPRHPEYPLAGIEQPAGRNPQVVARRRWLRQRIAQRHGETAAEEKRLSGRSQYRSLAQVSALRGLSAGPNPGFGPPRRLGSAERAFEGHFQHQNSRFPAWNGHKALLNREYFGGPAGKFQGGNCIAASLGALSHI
jgi:hypothetical protein